MRGIVGVAPDPIMFLAVYATDIKRSQSFYEALGMAEQVRLCFNFCCTYAFSNMLYKLFRRNILMLV